VATRAYQILDVGLAVETPQGASLGTFHQDYGRFEVPTLPPGHGLAVRFEQGDPKKGIFLEVDGLRQDLNGHPLPERFAAQVLARILMERVEAFTILHAAVLAHQGGALAISGPSGAGKTTLTLALLEQGWTYYSDDFCPLHRETGLVHPFPRSLWVRRAQGPEPSYQRPGKVLFPLEGERFSVGGPPLPLKWLICLGAKGDQDEPGMGSIRMDLRGGLGGTLLEELRGLEGTSLHAVDPGVSLRWTLRYRREGGRTRRIKELLHRHRDAIWNVFSQPEVHPDFSKEPVLATIPSHEAAFYLLQELKHDLGEVRRPGALRPGALLSHLVSLLSGVTCYRLTPGPLDRCLALIQAALNTVKRT